MVSEKQKNEYETITATLYGFEMAFEKRFLLLFRTRGSGGDVLLHFRLSFRQSNFIGLPLEAGGIAYAGPNPMTTTFSLDRFQPSKRCTRNSYIFMLSNLHILFIRRPEAQK